MKNKIAVFTAGEFAKLHHLNKRTLHYYDEIHLFSPKYKGENGYRYYTYEQSMELESILALRELGMSLEEIRNYNQNPNPSSFLKIAEAKRREIDKRMKRMKTIQAVLKQKETMLARCNGIYDQKIEIVNLNEECMLMTPLPLIFENDENLFQNAAPIMEHLRKSWELSAYKQSCGSYLSADKILNKKFDEYDGIFTTIDSKGKMLYRKPKGCYIRAFSVGSWEKIPAVYIKIIKFAEENNLTLTGYAFEMGMNDFAISNRDDYVTQIEIRCIGNIPTPD